MQKFIIGRTIVHYDSITKEKFNHIEYYVKVETDFHVNVVFWDSNKNNAKIFTNKNDAEAVAKELAGQVVNF